MITRSIYNKASKAEFGKQTLAVQVQYYLNEPTVSITSIKTPMPIDSLHEDIEANEDIEGERILLSFSNLEGLNVLQNALDRVRLRLESLIGPNLVGLHEKKQGN